MQKVIIATIFILSVLSIVLVLISGFNKPKTAFVDTIKLYNDFEYKKELEKKLYEVQRIRQQKLDSIMTDVQRLGNELQDEKNRDSEKVNRFEIVRKQYYLKKDQFEEDNQALIGQYNDKIWKQLNQYLGDYGKKEGYEYIFGADGQGRLMYAEKSKNITEAVLEYVNTRFNGEEK